MSLCDRCPAPGACCMSVNLSGRDGIITVWDDADATAQLHERFPHLANFTSLGAQETWAVPADAGEDAGRLYSRHNWGCTALDRATGRCTIYDHRPQLCADYQPGSGDGLCVFSQPLENGEESIL